MDFWQIARWLGALVVVIIASGGGTWLTIKRWFLPKQIVEIQDTLAETKAELKDAKNRLKTLESGTTKRSYDQGYEVLNWWGETGRIPTVMEGITAELARFAGGGRKRYPRTILIRKTGQIKELPYPPAANRIPSEGDDG